MKEQDAQDRHDESVAAKEYWEKLEAAAAAGDPEAVAKLDEIKQHASEGLKAWWAKLEAGVAAGDPAAVAKLDAIKEHASEGAKAGWARKKAAEA